MSPDRLAAIRRDLYRPADVRNEDELERWRVGYIAGLLIEGEATQPEVFALIQRLPGAAGLIRQAKAWRENREDEAEGRAA